MKGYLNMCPEWCGGRDALTAGAIQHQPPAGSLVLGYFISLIGTAVGDVAVDPIVDLGQWMMRSTAGTSLASELNMGFLTDRTQRMCGDLQWINAPAAAGDPINLHWFHSFDLSYGTHRNVYPVPNGDIFDIFLPAVPAGLVQAGTTWEVHCVTVDRGEAFYLPVFHQTNLPLAQGRYTMAGKTAMLQFQPEAGWTAPERLSIFTPGGRRHLFMGWPEAIGFTGMFGDYGANACDHVTYPFFTDDPSSIRKVFGMDVIAVEATNGVGNMPTSQCTITALPDEARQISDMANAIDDRTSLAKIAAIGGPSSLQAATALAGASRTTSPSPGIEGGMTTPGFASAPIRRGLNAFARSINAMRRG